MITQLESTNEFFIFDQQSSNKPQTTQFILSSKAWGSFDTHFVMNWNLNLGILSVLARV